MRPGARSHPTATHRHTHSTRRPCTPKSPGEVRGLGDALLPVRGGLLVLAVPGSYLKCRGIRQRRRTGHQVVGVGRVCQDLLVFVAATPLPCPSPSFTGDDGGLLVSMRGPKTPRASMAYTDAESTRATARTGTASGRIKSSSHTSPASATRRRTLRVTTFLPVTRPPELGGSSCP